MGAVAEIEKLLNQNGRKLTKKFKQHLGTLSKPEVEQILITTRREIREWYVKQAEEARALEAAQAAPEPVEEPKTVVGMNIVANSQPVRKIQLRKAEGN